jgi:cob(I)alamin adenosyltransferase
MSIVTRTGDAGTTALMYNRRVSKCDPRVEAYGTVDELNAALGVARATARDAAEQEGLVALQKDLVPLMGELATAHEDRDRYIRDGLPLVKPEFTAKLEAWVKRLEQQQIKFSGWATPGGNPHAAALDMARTICRRAERRICGLRESGQLENPEILIWLNRLSDLLWLLARQAEQETQAKNS